MNRNVAFFLTKALETKTRALLISKISLFLLLIFSCLSTIGAQSDREEELKEILALQQSSCSEEKIHVHTDRTIYRQDETIWLAAYLLGTDQTEASRASSVLNIELLSPSGTIVSSLKLAQSKGAFPGDIHIPANWPGGIYTLKAYTNYHGNFGEDWVFEKKLTVQKVSSPLMLLSMDFEREAYGAGDTVRAFLDARDLLGIAMKEETVHYQLQIGGVKIPTQMVKTNDRGAAILEAVLPQDLTTADLLLTAIMSKNGRTAQVSRRPKVVLENIQIRFMPEGGDWVSGLATNMAFAATDEWDKPVDVEGVIKDKNGVTVGEFRSLHDGMGKVVIQGDALWPLTAELVKPVAGGNRYPLPSPVSGRWNVNIDYEQGDQLSVRTNSLMEENLALVVRMYDKVVWTQDLALNKGKQTLELAVDSWPTGIAQVTVFDSSLRPVWERLIYMHPERSVELSATTTKEQYLPRSLVEMNIVLKDDTGKPLSGHFSASIVNDAMHTLADDKQADIQAQLLLCSELRGEIHEPNFYFDETEEDRLAALDLLMLTHGWRRFPWRQMQAMELADYQPFQTFKAERIQFSEKVYLHNQPAHGAKAVVLKTGYVAETDKDGTFVIPLTEASPGDEVEIRYKGLEQVHYLRSQSASLVGQPYLPGRMPQPPGLHVVENERADKKREVELDKLVEVAKEEPMPLDPWEQLEMEDMEEEEVLLDEVVVTAMGVNRQDKAMASSAMALAEMVTVAARDRDDFGLDVGMDDEIPVLHVPQNYGRQQSYYQAREFAFPVYKNQTERENPTPDMRKTIYWNPNINLDENGQAKVSFYTADEMTTYRVILEGISSEHDIVRNETTFAVAPPVDVQLDLPEYVTSGDQLSIPVRIQNLMNEETSMTLVWETATGAELSSAAIPSKLALKSKESWKETVKMDIATGGETMEFVLKVKGQQWEEEIRKQVKVIPKGFPTSASLSGSQSQGSYQFKIADAVPGSINGELKLFADVEGELLSGVESMLVQPNGCFEQTSSTNYPNIMVLQYLQGKNKLDAPTRTRAFSLLESGYNRLAGYEVTGGGFSLWGQAPAVPVLTAFGLMQFHDLDKVWPDVSQGMLGRTQDWLVNQFEQKPFSGSIDDAYILYALSSTGNYRNEDRVNEFTQKAFTGTEAYALALAARLNHQYNRPKQAKEALDRLLELFKKDQFATASRTPSLSHSQGQSVATEVTAWTILAALEQGKVPAELHALITFLSERRINGGRFGATPATVRALDAITKVEVASSRPKESGQLWLSINGTVVDSIVFDQQSPGVIPYDGLGKYFTEGNNTIELGYIGVKNPLPYSLEVDWETYTPPIHASAPLAIHTSIGSPEAKVGETVRYAIDLENLENKEGYAPMLLLSAPAGLEWQPWQLKEMQEERVFDYYEIKDQYLVLYFEKIAPRATKELRFDLPAIYPGEYQAPAATAYLYYYDEAKTWASGAAIRITAE